MRRWRLCLVLWLVGVLATGCQILVEPPEPSITWVPLPTLAPPATRALPTAPSSPTSTRLPTAEPTHTLLPGPTSSPTAGAAPAEPAAAASWARDQAWAYLLAEYPIAGQAAEPAWSPIEPEPLVGATRYRFEAGEWEASVSIPLLPRGEPLYSVDIEGPDGFTWQAQVRWTDAGPLVNAAAPVTRPQEEIVAGWGGKIIGLPASAEFDDYFRALGGSGGQYGIIGLTDEIEQRIVALRDSQRIVMVWGVLQSGAQDYGETQLVVERLELAGEAEASLVPTAIAATLTPTEAATLTPTEAATTAPTPAGPPSVTPLPPTLAPATAIPASEIVEGWIGVVRPLPVGARYDDYFDAQAPVGQYGIAGLARALEENLAEWRASGTLIRVWGVLDYGVDDYAGARLLVSRAEPLQ